MCADGPYRMQIHLNETQDRLRSTNEQVRTYILMHIPILSALDFVLHLQRKAGTEAGIEVMRPYWLALIVPGSPH